MKLFVALLAAVVSISAHGHTMDERLKVQLRKEEVATITGVTYSLWRQLQYPVLLPRLCFPKGITFETVADEVIDATRHLIEHEPQWRDDLLQAAFIMTHEVWACPHHPVIF